MEEYIAPKRKRIPYGMMNFAISALTTRSLQNSMK